MRRLFFALLLLAAPVSAGELTLSWTAPVGTESCVAGPPLTDLAGFRIYKLVTDIPNPSLTTYTQTGLHTGDHTYMSTAYNLAGVESRASNPVTKAVTTFGVSDTMVMSVVKVRDRIILVPIGTIPLGTPCDEAYSVNGHHAVPSAAVTWTLPQNRAQFVVAQCGS